MSHRVIAGTITPPAAGQDFSYCFSQNEHVKLISLFGTFTTGAAVANRFPALYLQSQDGILPYTMGATTAQTASQSQIYQISKAFGTINTSSYAGLTVTNLSLPEIVLPPGWVIGSLTSGIAAADRWTGLVWVAEFGPTTFVEDQRELQELQALRALQAA